MDKEKDLQIINEMLNNPDTVCFVVVADSEKYSAEVRGDYNELLRALLTAMHDFPELKKLLRDAAMHL